MIDIKKCEDVASETLERHGSTIVDVLERAWAKLQGVLPDLPPAVITLISLSSRHKQKGYVSFSAWTVNGNGMHEVGLNPLLNSRPDDLVATMVHEAAHALLFERIGNGGVSENYQYHRKEFRDEAIRLGLQCEWRDGRYGWNITYWPTETGVPMRYREIANFLKTELPIGAKGLGFGRSQGKRLPPKGQVALTCSCETPKRVIYASRSSATVGSIRCEICTALFHAEKRIEVTD